MTDDEPPLRIEIVRPWADADVLTVAEAARRLKLRRADCQAWLERLGLLVDVAGSSRVVWGSVIQVLQAKPEPPKQAARGFRPTAAPVR